jgi:hypothetical protein
MAGAPQLYKTPKELQKAIDEFIANPPTRTARNKDGEEYEIPIVTISRMCYELGFASRQSFYDYEKRDEFSYTIKRARLYMESEYEANLTSAACTGSIFALKNMGWDDKTQQEISGKDGAPLVPVLNVTVSEA